MNEEINEFIRWAPRDHAPGLLYSLKTTVWTETRRLNTENQGSLGATGPVATETTTFTSLRVAYAAGSRLPCVLGECGNQFSGPSAPISTATKRALLLPPNSPITKACRPGGHLSSFLGYLWACYKPAGFLGDLIHWRTRPLWKRQLSH